MAARLIWVLLLLAAVFTMHGVQCPAPGLDPGHGSAASAGSESYVIGSSGTEHSVVGMAADSSAALPVVVPAGQASDGLPASGVAFWAVCFAVLLSGAVFLAVAALLRRASVRIARVRVLPSLWHTGRVRLPRPPDLSALCLLRI